MKKLFLIVALPALMVGCRNTSGNKTHVEKERKTAYDLADTLSTNAAAPVERVTTDLTLVSFNWSDSLLKMYMAFADNPTVKLARKDNAPEEWVYDNTIKTDSAVYDTYRIGHDVSEPNPSDPHFTVDQLVYIDTFTKQLYEYNKLDETLKKWWTAEDVKHFFYPVYELSPKTTAMVINFREYENPKLVDTLFNQYCPNPDMYDRTHLPRGCKIYDTSGLYDLLRNDKLEKEVRKYYDQEFYVYGTKGYVKTSIKNIVFGVDECITSIFAFCFDNASLRTIGHPVFCSTKLLDLTYARDYSAVEKRITNYFLANGSYYLDGKSKSMKVLGNAGNLYFTYFDDFEWGRNRQGTTCEFPGRSVWWLEKRTIAGFWNSNLALICD